MIPKKEKTHKYHKTVHIPNFVSLEKYKDFGGYNYASGVTSGFKWYNLTANDSDELTLSSHMVADFEGICGITPTFTDGDFMQFPSTEIEFPKNIDGTRYLISPKEAFSVMFHMRTTSAPAGESIDIMGICRGQNNGNNVLKVKLNKHNQIEVTIGSKEGSKYGGSL